jgi:hypothetical protein
MGGIDLLLADFDAPDLPEDLARQFKQLALRLKDLPHPQNVRAVRTLLDVRGLTVHAR